MLFRSLEIAHHYAVDRAQLLEAYEVAAQLPDLDENVVPIVVHMRNDFPLSHQAKLALVDECAKHTTDCCC